MPNRIDRGRDTTVVVTESEGHFDCHIAAAGENMNAVIAQTTMESHRVAREVCDQFPAYIRCEPGPSFALRRASSEVASSHNGA